MPDINQILEFVQNRLDSHHNTFIYILYFSNRSINYKLKLMGEETKGKCDDKRMELMN